MRVSEEGVGGNIHWYGTISVSYGKGEGSYLRNRIVVASNGGGFIV